jgi:hypothetical protein
MGDAMSDVERLRERFVAEFEAGRQPDPREYLAQLEGEHQRELEVLLDAYLERAPRRPFDSAAFAASPARALADDLEQALGGRSGAWPVVLPRLRQAARLKRADLVHRLAEALGVADREPKVERYYHAMEQGLLEPSGVSDRVLDALAALVGTSRERLREAAAALTPGGTAPAAPHPPFARTATPDAEALAAMSPSEQGEHVGTEPYDEVDELFTGGR